MSTIILVGGATGCHSEIPRIGLIECLFNTLYACIVSYTEKFINLWPEFVAMNSFPSVYPVNLK
ncbi:hypothetical protein N9V62_06975, partial [Porticoccaceae bacterium]|nr:hypothetical protein [Porticoccaceae bacterium]